MASPLQDRSDLKALLRWDGHTHTHLCPHGNRAPLEQYLKQAVQLGLERYTVTEHPPLPNQWLENQPLQSELGIMRGQLNDYFEAVNRCKDACSDSIEILTGFELDYLYGNETFTTALVDQVVNHLDEAILSVHFLPGRGGNRCIDYTPNDFEEGLLAYYGTMDAVVNAYYDHVELAIAYAATLPIRVRIGHINLIEKFRLSLPEMDDALLKSRQERLIPHLVANHIGVDVNMAGLRKDTCQKPYVERWFVERCREEGVACVYGSDAHRPEDVGAHVDTWIQWIEDIT